jgi:two-component system sensor histidine kinase TtrS
VSDNGPPVSDEVFAKIGRAGFSSKSDGLGFGLSIAQAIAERHDGHLEFRRSSSGSLQVLLHLRRYAAEEGKNNAQ